MLELRADFGNDFFILFFLVIEEKLHNPLRYTTFFVCHTKTRGYLIVLGQLSPCIQMRSELLDVIASFVLPRFPDSAWETLALSKGILLGLFLECSETIIYFLYKERLISASNYISFYFVVVNDHEM